MVLRIAILLSFCLLLVNRQKVQSRHPGATDCKEMTMNARPLSNNFIISDHID